MSCQQANLTPCLRATSRQWGTWLRKKGLKVVTSPALAQLSPQSDACSGQSPNQCWFLSWGRARSEPQAQGTGGTHLQRAHREPCDDQRRELAKQVYKRQEGFQHHDCRSVEGGTFCLSSQTRVSAEAAVLTGSGLIWKESG